MEWTYINRELSWLNFNKRVIQQAQNQANPLFERMRFISIYHSNLDEFTMVRIGGLVTEEALKTKQKDTKSNLSAKEQLQLIYKRIHELNQLKDEVYQALIHDFSKISYLIGMPQKMNRDDINHIDRFYEHQIKPFLTPLVNERRNSLPQFVGGQLYIVARIKKKGEDKDLLGFAAIPQHIMPIFSYRSGKKTRIVLSETLIEHYVHDLFSGYQVDEALTLKVVRNVDIDFDQYQDEEIHSTYIESMKKLLKKRRRLEPVMLHMSKTPSSSMLKALQKHLKVDKEAYYVASAPLSYQFMKHLEILLRKAKEDVFYPYYNAVLTPYYDDEATLIPQILKKDGLLIYPYHSMRTILKLIEEAAKNPEVISIKITLYRLAQQSKIIDALIEAADRGKEVIVYLELKARFDEANNIEWSSKLEASLVQVVYGYDHYKIHSKSMLISMATKQKVQHIAHIGTGNYNENTAIQYADINLLTADPRITEDLVSFFKHLSLSDLSFATENLLIAPDNFKTKMIALIRREISYHETFGNGKMILKMNSLTDKDLIDAIYEAHDKGVDITLIVRGICCLVANESLRVFSLLGRYLEHARIYYFYARGAQELYFGSADLMTRNTERRIELVSPVYDAGLKQDLIQYLLMQIKDPHVYQMHSNGEYLQVDNQSEVLDSQSQMMELALKSRYIKDKKIRDFGKEALRKLRERLGWHHDLG